MHGSSWVRLKIVEHPLIRPIVLAVPTMTPSFFHSMSAAFALAEALAALAVAERGPQAVEATQRTDQELRSLHAYLGAKRGTRRRAPAVGGKP